MVYTLNKVMHGQWQHTNNKGKIRITELNIDYLFTDDGDLLSADKLRNAETDIINTNHKAEITKVINAIHEAANKGLLCNRVNMPYDKAYAISNILIDKGYDLSFVSSTSSSDYIIIKWARQQKD